MIWWFMAATAVLLLIFAVVCAFISEDKLVTTTSSTSSSLCDQRKIDGEEKTAKETCIFPCDFLSLTLQTPKLPLALVKMWTGHHWL